MSAGRPLDDDDRRPWLETLASLLAVHEADGVGTVLTCSALRRSYRDLLRGGLPAGAVYFVHLAAPESVLRDRMERRDHFMPASLLRSQLATLEPLRRRGRCGRSTYGSHRSRWSRQYLTTSPGASPTRSSHPIRPG